MAVENKVCDASCWSLIDPTFCGTTRRWHCTIDGTNNIHPPSSSHYHLTSPPSDLLMQLGWLLHIDSSVRPPSSSVVSLLVASSCLMPSSHRTLHPAVTIVLPPILTALHRLPLKSISHSIWFARLHHDKSQCCRASKGGRASCVVNHRSWLRISFKSTLSSQPTITCIPMIGILQQSTNDLMQQSTISGSH